MNRSDGLDFADADPISDVPSTLQRNKTERRRLQGLMRVDSTTAAPRPFESTGLVATLRARWDHWMVNDGGRQLFFGVYVLLHLLVFALGFVHYDLKDNSVGARKLFGITFRASFIIYFI